MSQDKPYETSAKIFSEKSTNQDLISRSKLIEKINELIEDWDHVTGDQDYRWKADTAKEILQVLDTIDTAGAD